MGVIRGTKKRNQRRSRRLAIAPKPDYEKSACYYSTINIAGYAIPVFKVKKFKVQKDSSEIIGLWWPETQQLYLLEAYATPHSQSDTMLHELLHAISSLCLTTEARLSEVQVNTLSTVLLDTLNRNPEFKETIFAYSNT